MELLLSAWRAVRERSPISISQSIAGWAKAWTVNEWYHPALAAEEFGDQDWLRDLKEAKQERDKAWDKRDKGITIGHRRIVGSYSSLGEHETPEVTEARARFDMLDQRYEDAQRKVDVFINLIYGNLNA